LKKFDLFSTDELRFIASLITGREMLGGEVSQTETGLYSQIIFELRDRRILDETKRRLI